MIFVLPWIVTISLLLGTSTDAWATRAARSELLAEDLLVPSREPARIDVLLRTTLFSLWERSIGGELIRFSSRSGVVGRAMTGGDGRARITVSDLTEGIHSYEAETVPSSRVGAARCRVTVAVWPINSPLVLINLNTILPDGGESTGLFSRMPEDWVPPRGALQGLKFLAKRYRIVFLTSRPVGELEGIRARMKRYHLPPGPILHLGTGFGLRSIEEAVDRKLTMIEKSGWTNLIGGVGGSLDDALAFTHHGMKAVILSDPIEKEDLPAGARKVTSWDAVPKELMRPGPR
jgi:hypothetical protein